MRRGALALVFSLLLSSQAHALDLEGVGLLGTGLDVGDADNNPYALQLGGALELTVFGGLVGGIRATRSLGTSCSSCLEIDDLRSFGGDLGIDWEFTALHVSPRFGFGHLHERGGFNAAYFEPGGVIELEIALFVLGIDVRYRLVASESDANGMLGYLRAGIRL